MAAERVKDEFNEHSNKEEYAIFHSSGDTQYIDEEDFGEGGGGGGGGGEGGGASRIRTATKNVRRGGRTWQTGWCISKYLSGNNLRENLLR